VDDPNRTGRPFNNTVQERTMFSARQFFMAAMLVAVAAALSGCASVSGALGGYTSRVPGEDGRFTIGTGTKRLMYGYPIPYSTSHFVVAVDGKYASNNPRFPDNIEYLTGTLLSKGGEASAHTEISFSFQGLDITQRLIPVDANFRDVPVGGWGQYYRIEYEITNPSDATKTVGLSLLIDTMIDDNDASQMDADGTRVAQQASFHTPSVPGEVYVYRVPGNNTELVASLVTAKGKAVKPDYLFVGRWPYLHSVVWDVNLVDGGYTDSGLLLKWDLAEIPARGKRYLATHYGLPNGGQLSLLTAAEGFRKDTANVYFDLGKADLSADAKQRIDAALSGRNVSGAFIEVYTDAVGNEAANLALSKKRADNVTAYLKTKNVQPTVIIPKSYGESYADQSEEARKAGKQQDRRATIVIFSR
jgi:outer membrane protein OmpA-like peptidoglycan-associated protein